MMLFPFARVAMSKALIVWDFDAGMMIFPCANDGVSVMSMAQLYCTRAN